MSKSNTASFYKNLLNGLCSSLVKDLTSLMTSLFCVFMLNSFAMNSKWNYNSVYIFIMTISDQLFVNTFYNFICRYLLRICNTDRCIYTIRERKL